MPGRRFIASLLSALMLHLTLVGADWRCARHADMARGTTAMPAMSHQMGALIANPGLVATESSDQPCDTPIQPNCCRAMTSCSVTFGLGDELHPASAPLVHESTRPGSVIAPASLIVAPDPPPPKA
jgi:hypothetical protein